MRPTPLFWPFTLLHLADQISLAALPLIAALLLSAGPGMSGALMGGALAAALGSMAAATQATIGFGLSLTAVALSPLAALRATPQWA